MNGVPVIGGLKRMAQFMAGQLKSAVDITGGTIAGVNLSLASGKTGTFTANGATPVTVTNANITANSVVAFGLKTVGGTVSPNGPAMITVTPGTGFTVAGTALDTSVYNYAIIG